MYPQDATTTVGVITGNTERLLVPTSTNTILGVRLQQSGTASETHISCGTVDVISNFGKDFPQANIQYLCTSAIYAHKTGNDTSWYAVTFVNRNRASTTDTYPYGTIDNTLGMTPLTNYVVQVGSLTALWFVGFVCAYFLIKKFF